MLPDIKIDGSRLLDLPVLGLADVAAVKGKPIEEVRGTIATFKTLMTRARGPARGLWTAEEPQPVDLRALGELAALQGVVKFPVRIKCATLAWNTLAQGLDELEV